MLTAATLTAASSAEAASNAHVIRVACSTPALVAAINSANATPATLRLAPSCTYVVLGGLPTISGTMTFIGGPGTRLRATDTVSNNFRILSVIGGSLRVQGISIENATLLNAGGAAILNLQGTLVLDRVTLAGNTVTGGAGALQNAADSRTLVVRSTFVGNTSQAATEAGGAIVNAGTLTLFQSRISANNTSDSGGGLATSAGGTTHVIQSTIDHNVATGNGGGIVNAGTTTIDRTLITRNRAATGGGIFGTVTIRRSIVHFNVPDNCNPADPACG